MPNANPAWFDENYFATQKLLQMQILGDTAPDGATPLEQVNAAIAEYNASTGANVTLFSNFEACNTSAYGAGVLNSAINVSPNALFDVPYYLTALAAYANESGYTATGYAAGEWTAQTVLQHMFNDGHMSAWDHFKDAGLDAMINPSADFNTAAYIAAKAEATGMTESQVIVQMKADGLNPVQDYFINGQDYITADELKVPASDVLTPTMNNGQQWGEAAPAPDSDPYDENATTITMTAAQTEYTGEAGNDIFSAVWTSDPATRTLNQNDVIDGGEGLNTLAVELGQNWGGFKSPGKAEDGTALPNVTNVGRIQLNHVPKGNGLVNSSEASFTFDATGIEGAERLDINNSGSGTISVSNLTASVNQVDISGASNSTKGTTLSWVDGALDGTADALALTLENVGVGGTKAAAAINAEGIEILNVNAVAGSSNNVDVTGFSDLQAVNVSGAGNLTVYSPLKGVTTFDASEATGNVTFAVGKIGNDTVIKGGVGHDMVTLQNASNTLASPQWTSIEGIALAATANGCNINAAGIPDLEHLDIYNAAGNDKLYNVKADDFVINGNAAGSTNVTVNGEITNLTYNTALAQGGNVTSDATGNVNVNINAPDSSHTGTFTGKFTVNSAEGDVALNVAEDATFGGASAQFNAKLAQSFTALIDGTLADGTTFNVVGDDVTNGVVKISAAAVSAAATGITLNADGASTVELDITGASTWKGSLDGAQAVVINLENTAGENATADSFDATAIDLSSVGTVKVQAGGETVKLGALGDAKQDGGIQLTIDEADQVQVGAMTTNKGFTIDANINASGAVTLGSAIAAGTVENTNDEGDVILTVAGASVTGLTSISGDDLNIDFSAVTGTTVTGTGITLSADSGIQFAGAEGADKITIAKIGDEGGTITLGGDADSLTIEATAAVTKNALTQITVDLDDGGTAAVDTLEVKGQSAGSLLAVNVSGFDATSANQDALTFVSQAVVIDDAVDMLAKFGISGFSEEDLQIGTWNSLSGVYDGSNVYLFDNSAVASATTVVVIEDATGFTATA